MKITVFGSGYVGLVQAAVLAEVGHDVVCMDIDQKKVELLRQGHVSIFEPGLSSLVREGLDSNRLHFTSDEKLAVQHGRVAFIAVGTPSSDDGSADLKYVLSVGDAVARHREQPLILVEKSTVPVGTGDTLRAHIQAALDKAGRELQFDIVSNPEFLKEGSAVADCRRPDRIVIGCEGTEVRDVMRDLYAPFNRNHDRILFMDLRSAELTKYAANAMLATRISFMNEMANLADRLGVDIEPVRVGIGADPRIGDSFLYPGVGYGGSCFPKDVTALQRMGDDVGLPLRLLAAVAQVNEGQKRQLVDRLVQRLGPDFSGQRFALWGLAFKPNTDDMREAPSRVLVRELLERGAVLQVFDPVAMQEARRCLQDDLQDRPDLLERIRYAQSPMDAARDADALLIVTEWQVFRSPDFDALRAVLRQPLVVDGRNLYEPRSMRALGFDYLTVGRNAVDAPGATTP